MNKLTNHDLSYIPQWIHSAQQHFRLFPYFSQTTDKTGIALFIWFLSLHLRYIFSLALTFFRTCSQVNCRIGVVQLLKPQVLPQVQKENQSEAIIPLESIKE